MKWVMVLLCLLPMGPASAAEAPLFSCSLGQKRVSVAAVGNELVYRFGSRARNELTIVGSAARGNLSARTARYANIEHQLRFTRGRFSYIVFSLAAKPSVGARGVSGLTVLDGIRQVAAFTCRRWTELDSSRYERLGLPEDGDEYSAL